MQFFTTDTLNLLLDAAILGHSWFLLSYTAISMFFFAQRRYQPSFCAIQTEAPQPEFELQHEVVLFESPNFTERLINEIRDRIEQETGCPVDIDEMYEWYKEHAIDCGDGLLMPSYCDVYDHFTLLTEELMEREAQLSSAAVTVSQPVAVTVAKVDAELNVKQLRAAVELRHGKLKGYYKRDRLTAILDGDLSQL